jgi:large subunit ribosomal protein L21
MYAVIQTGGKQYRVTPGEDLKVEKRDGRVGDTILFDRVLLVCKDDEVTVGKPIVEKAKVHAKITQQARAPKIIVFKYKKRKGYRKKQGHRQGFTGVRITQIEA